MKWLYVFAVVALSLFLGRKYIAGFILTLRDKKKKKTDNVSAVNKDLIYVPILSSRTFHFTIQIDEVGEGKATLTIVKNPVI